MQHPSKLSAGLLAAIIVAAGFVSISWFDTPGTPINTNYLDTLPKREKKMREEKKKEKHKTIIAGDIDETMDQLNSALDNLDQQLESKDWDKINRQLHESFEKIDAQKIERQIEEAMKNIDEQKIRLQTEEALKKLDWDKIESDIRKSIAEAKDNINSEKMQAELQKALEQSKAAMAEVKNIDMDKIRLDLNKAKEELKEQQGQLKEELEKAQKEIQQNLGRNFKQELEKAKDDVLRAKEEMKAYKTMLADMEKDGLINTKENYTIEYKDGELYINGKIQPAAIRDKYKSYFKKDNIKIKKVRDSDDDDNDDDTI